MTYFAGLLVGYVISPFPEHLGASAIVALVAGVSAAILVGIVVHELGHVLAVRLSGRWPTAIHLLGPPDRVAFHVGALRVGVGVRHTLAVVRLRQGRPADVRQLCADALAADLDRDDRASVLATVAMAKRQLGFPASARQVLSEALALDPSAELVPEAVSTLSDGATACRTSHPA